MRGNTFKKAAALTAAVTMTAQFGFVLPVGAASHYSSDNGGYGSWTTIGGTVTEETDSTEEIGAYAKHTTSVTESGNRAAYLDFSDAVKSLSKCVLEFDYKYTPARDRAGQFAIADSSIAKPKTNDPLSESLITFDYTQGAKSLTVNGVSVEKAVPDSWMTVKTLFDFEEHTAVLVMTSLDETETYYEAKFEISETATDLSYLWSLAPRYAGANSIDNIEVIDATDREFPTFYKVTYTGGIDESTEYVKSGESPKNAPETAIKAGPYKFTGQWKVGDSVETVSTEELSNLTITADTVIEAQFEDDPTAIEPMTSMRIKTHPDLMPEVPEKASDGTDVSFDYPVELEIIGAWGNDLTSEDYPYPDMKGELKVEWDIQGMDILNGELTGEPATNSEGDLVYCDSYMVLDGFTDNATSGNIRITSGIGNYFGNFNVKVTYGSEEAGYTELTDSFPLIIMSDDTQVANRIYPFGGYPVDLDWYSDGLVGYKVSEYSNNTNIPDSFMSGWCTWGGRSTKAMYLMKEDGGEKYLYATGGSATNSSVYCALNIGSVGEQAYADFDIQFSTAGESIQLMDVDGKNSDYTGSLNDSGFRAVHTTPYKNTISFDGSSLSFADQTINGLEPGKWYNVRISFDDLTQQLWYSVYDTEEEKLLGKTDAISYDTSATSEPLNITYFTLVPAATANTGIKIKDMVIYKPDMESFEVTSETETVTIPSIEATQIAVENTDSSSNTVTAEVASGTVSVSIENKTGVAETVTAYTAVYTGDVLTGVQASSTEIGIDATETVSVGAADNSKLFVWDSHQKPLIKPVEIPASGGTEAEPATATLNAVMKDAEGNNLSGMVEWSLKDIYEGVSIESTGISSAKLIVTDEATSGDVVIVASNRGQSDEYTIRLTGSDDNISFINPVSSITIPFEGEPETVTYSAEVRTGSGDTIEGKTITYAMYNSSNTELLDDTSAISFDENTATLTVTSDARAQVVYIRATSTNTEGDTISRSVRVTIHGLTFDFGASDIEGVAEGYTAITPSTTYNDTRGYGITSTDAVAGGSTDTDALNGDYIEASSITFSAKVVKGKNYRVTATYKGSVSVERIDADCSGVTKTTNADLTEAVFNVAVIDDVIDMTFTDAQVASIEIEMLPDNAEKAKPSWYTYGDSTTNSSTDGKVGWGNRVQNYTTMFNVSNTARSGSNPSTFYNGGNMDNILLNLAPGDLVTFNGMGTNSYTSNFKTEVQTLIQACRDRGAYIIMTTYTPHGPVADSNWANRYDSTTQTFSTTRDTDGYTTIYREIAEEDSEILIDFGKIANDNFNKMVDDASLNDAEAREAKAQEIISHFLDHNHYDDTMANWMAEWFAPYIEEAYTNLVTNSIAE